jgi:hypothetical protein
MHSEFLSEVILTRAGGQALLNLSEKEDRLEKKEPLAQDHSNASVAQSFNLS